MVRLNVYQYWCIIIVVSLVVMGHGNARLYLEICGHEAVFEYYGKT